MRLRKWKSFLCICISGILTLSIAAYGEPITITPLDESQVSSFQSGNNSGAGELSGGPGGSESSDSPLNGTQPPGSSGTQPPGSSGTQPPSNSGTQPPGSSGAQTPSNSGTQTPGNAGSQTAGNTDNGSLSVNLEAGASLQKPVIASEGAVLMEASTGAVLFSQNGDKQFYPASITKLMTALLTAEAVSLDSNVTFSSTATTNLEAGAVSINMTAGDVMTVRQCLYALLLKSANEVGNALAENVAGSNQPLPR